MSSSEEVLAKLQTAWPCTKWHVGYQNGRTMVSWQNGPRASTVAQVMPSTSAQMIVVERRIDPSEASMRMLAKVYLRHKALALIGREVSSEGITKMCRRAARKLENTDLSSSYAFEGSEVLKTAIALLGDNLRLEADTSRAQASRLGEALTEYGVAELFAAAESFCWQAHPGRELGGRTLPGAT